jgi:hypothetical protein
MKKESSPHTLLCVDEHATITAVFRTISRVNAGSPEPSFTLLWGATRSRDAVRPPLLACVLYLVLMYAR